MSVPTRVAEFFISPFSRPFELQKEPNEQCACRKRYSIHSRGSEGIKRDIERQRTSVGEAKDPGDTNERSKLPRLGNLPNQKSIICLSLEDI